MRHLLIVTTEVLGCCFSNDFCRWFVVVVCPQLLSLLLWFWLKWSPVECQLFVVAPPWWSRARLSSLWQLHWNPTANSMFQFPGEVLIPTLRTLSFLQFGFLIPGSETENLNGSHVGRGLAPPSSLHSIHPYPCSSEICFVSEFPHHKLFPNIRFLCQRWCLDEIFHDKDS